MNTSLLLLLFVAIGLLVAYFAYRKNFKILKVPSVCLITGGVKTGKTSLSVSLSTTDFKKRHRNWWFATKFLHKKLEEPLYYTNSVISFGNIKRKKPHKLDRCIRYLSLEHLNRNIRFNYKSVIYIQESSLMADNMDYNNQEHNVDLSLFNKLIAHMTRGGSLYYDTQSVLDNHYSMKRVCSTYFFIQKNINLLLFRVLYIREMINTENGVNNFTDDVDTTTRKYLIPFWHLHRFDRYEFSYLTDDLPLDNGQTPKHNGIVSFNPLYIRKADKRNKEKERKVQ